MNILVLAQYYPMPGIPAGAMYIHMRNKYYVANGAKVTVLNFRAKENAVYDGIPVITWDSFASMEDKDQFDILVSHASNLKNHYRFLKKYGKHFKHYAFVFHGHEVLRIKTVYPPRFSWKPQSNPLRVAARDMYDTVKLHTWKKFFENRANAEKSHLIFVSQWMQDEFLKNTGVNADCLRGRMHIIYNSVGKAFEENVYTPAQLQYDFVTIRWNIDGEKYCVDVVNSLAKANPQYRFLVVGRGELFQHIEKANNLTWQDRSLFHNEMFDVLNRCRFALMPTKTDAQGLMMCEMATFGIPVVTSDIPVCHEVLDDFDKVAFVSNQGTDDLTPIMERFQSLPDAARRRNRKFFEENTSGEEYRLFQKIVG